MTFTDEDIDEMLKRLARGDWHPNIPKALHQLKIDRAFLRVEVSEMRAALERRGEIIFGKEGD